MYISEHLVLSGAVHVLRDSATKFNLFYNPVLLVHYPDIGLAYIELLKIIYVNYIDNYSQCIFKYPKFLLYISLFNTRICTSNKIIRD